MAYRLTLTQWSKFTDQMKDKGFTCNYPTGRNDGFFYQTGNNEGLAQFHIHSVENVDGNNMVFSKLLVKSGNWRSGNEPDLATFTTDQWVAQCQDTDSSVRAVVKAVQECFVALGAVKS